jgi:hypothetical protein
MQLFDTTAVRERPLLDQQLDQHVFVEFQMNMTKHPP